MGTDQGEYQKYQFHACTCYVGQLGVIGKYAYAHSRQEFGYGKSQSGDASSKEHCQIQDLEHTVKLARPVVVACYGLHCLVESHNHHHNQESYAVDYAVSTNCNIAAIFEQTPVDKQYHKACCGVHETGRQTYGKHILYQVSAQTVGAALKMYELTFIGELKALPCECQNLRYDGSYCRPLDSPMEHHYKQVVQKCVEQYRAYGGEHGLVGVSGSTQDAVDS